MQRKDVDKERLAALARNPLSMSEADLSDLMMAVDDGSDFYPDTDPLLEAWSVLLDAMRPPAGRVESASVGVQPVARRREP